MLHTSRAPFHLGRHQIPAHPHIYVDEEEIWFPERCDLQDLILRDLMSPAEAAQGGKSAGDGTGGTETTEFESPVYFLIGLPGSGKTRALRPIAMRHAGLIGADVLASDADEVRCRFPESQRASANSMKADDLSGAHRVHERVAGGALRNR